MSLLSLSSDAATNIYNTQHTQSQQTCTAYDTTFIHIKCVTSSGATDNGQHKTNEFIEDR